MLTLGRGLFSIHPSISDTGELTRRGRGRGGGSVRAAAHVSQGADGDAHRLILVVERGVLLHLEGV